MVQLIEVHRLIDVNRFSISCAKPWAFRYDVPAWCSTGSCGCMAIAAIGTDQHFSALHGGEAPDVRKIRWCLDMPRCWVMSCLPLWFGCFMIACAMLCSSVFIESGSYSNRCHFSRNRPHIRLTQHNQVDLQVDLLLDLCCFCCRGHFDFRVQKLQLHEWSCNPQMRTSKKFQVPKSEWVFKSGACSEITVASILGNGKVSEWFNQCNYLTL